MDWRKALAYITGTVDEELLLHNEYLSVENRILIQQLVWSKNLKRLPAQCLLHGSGQGAWVVLTGRCGCPRWVEQLGAGLAVVAVNRVALIWKLARMDLLTIRGLDGLIRIPRLPACCAARLRRPEMHRLRGDPEGQAATVAQAIFILRPVAYPELHLRNVMAALGVEFFGHAVSIAGQRAYQTNSVASMHQSRFDLEIGSD